MSAKSKGEASRESLPPSYVYLVEEVEYMEGATLLGVYQTRGKADVRAQNYMRQHPAAWVALGISEYRKQEGLEAQWDCGSAWSVWITRETLDVDRNCETRNANMEF